MYLEFFIHQFWESRFYPIKHNEFIQMNTLYFNNIHREQR